MIQPDPDSPSTAEAAADPPAPLTDEDLENSVRTLPTQVGVVLVLAGITGMVLPGSPGLPLVAAGGLVLSPRLFDRVDGWMKQNFPDARRHGMRTVFRFAADLQRRYPEQ